MAHRKHPWFRRRGYPHFDHPINLRDAERIVTRPEQVARHSFYPFVEFTLQTFKVKHIEEKLKRVSKERPIAYASHVDSHIYSYYSLRLSEYYEKAVATHNIGRSVLAFRALGKSNIDFAADAFDSIRLHGDCHVLALDISGFFDNLDHATLKRAWATVLGVKSLPADHYAVFKSLTKFATVNQEALYATLKLSLNNKNSTPSRLCSPRDFRNVIRANELVRTNLLTKGIPQGSPLSALLSNIYMLEFDLALSGFVRQHGGEYFRYCDDILVIVPSDAGSIVEPFVVKEISQLHLAIHPDKTDRVSFRRCANGDVIGQKNLQYLGFLFDGKKILLRSASLARYSQKMRRGVRVAAATMNKRNTARERRGDAPRSMFLKTLYSRYSHLGRRNFLTYGYKAADRMKSNAIRKQLKALWPRLQSEIQDVT